ncbi:MAG: hypothetical protein IT458_16445 [Planctomycetes bacterium]|nr:hypothetical protein [Planctomycetota bacterium]
MLRHLIAILGLALLCALWLWVQRWVARRDPAAGRRLSRCGVCACGGGECAEEQRAREDGEG